MNVQKEAEDCTTTTKDTLVLLAMCEPIIASLQSLYHNYKGYFSTASTAYDVGGYGNNNDCDIVKNSKLGEFIHA